MLATIKHVFNRAANAVACKMGTPWSFAIAFVLVVIWAVSGPALHFSETWQLIANTGTTIVTFLMVFLVQCSQNQDSRMFHLKLAELVRVEPEADERFMSLETLTDAELTLLRMWLAKKKRELAGAAS